MKKLLLNPIMLSAFFLFSEAQTTHAEDPFLDEFDGTELDPSWLIFDNEGGTHKGFTGDGAYEIVDSQSTADAGLGRPTATPALARHVTRVRRASCPQL